MRRRSDAGRGRGAASCCGARTQAGGRARRGKDERDPGRQADIDGAGIDAGASASNCGRSCPPSIAARPCGLRAGRRMRARTDLPAEPGRRGGDPGRVVAGRPCPGARCGSICT